MIKFGATVTIPLSPLAIPETVWFETEQARNDFLNLADAAHLAVIWRGEGQAHETGHDGMQYLYATYRKMGWAIRGDGVMVQI